MKRTTIIIHTAFLFVVTLIMDGNASSFSLPQSDTAQEKEPAKVRSSYEFSQFKNDDGSRSLTYSLHYIMHVERKAIKWAPVTFFAGTDSVMELGTAKTDVKGLARFDIPVTTLLPKDLNGMLTVGARYAGDSIFDEGEDQVSVKDLNMKISLLDDSIRTVGVKAWETGPGDGMVPLPGATVVFYIPRMFSNLKIGEGTTDDNGECSIDFPADIPGDSTGMLTILARIEEHETFGNVQADTLVRWGVPALHQVPASFRALWTKVAPTWMVYTLIILLLGVWGHYAFAVFQMARIKREAKNPVD